MGDDVVPPSTDEAPRAAGNEFGVVGTGQEQVDALQLYAYSKGIKGAPKPRIKMPGDNVKIGDFAMAFWTLIKEQNVFRRDVHAGVMNAEKRRFDFLDADMTVILGDMYLDFFKQRAVKVGDEIEYREVGRSLTSGMAKTCIAQVKMQPTLLHEVEKINFAPMPTRRRDGKIELLKPGYDEESRTFTFPCGFELDETMTLEAAHLYLRQMYQEFPFGDGVDDPERSLAVQIAGGMTLFASGLLSRGASRPMFIYNANAPRSGKSLLAKINLLGVFGSASSAAWSENNEEFRKSLETAANTAEPYIFYDNVRRHMASADLERFVTSPDVTCRVMGKNTEQITVPNVATVLITANNATTSTDIAERALFVNLFVNEADPQARRIVVPIDEVEIKRPEYRMKMLSAMWAMIRHWAALPAEMRKAVGAAGRLVGFEQWTTVIGGIVIAAGFKDPTTRPKLSGIGDLLGQKMAALVAKLWTVKNVDHEVFEQTKTARAFTFGQLAKVCAEAGLFDEYVPDEGEMKPQDRSKFGKFLKRYVGADGRTFVLKSGIDGTEARVRFGHNGQEGRAKRFEVAEVQGS